MDVDELREDEEDVDEATTSSKVFKLGWMRGVLMKCMLNIWYQFYQHFTCAYFIRKCFAQLFLVTFQLCNFWRQNIGVKCRRKKLMKLTSGLNFINILLEAFFVFFLRAAFLYSQFGFVIFWQKNICAKAAYKMLVKLASSVNFTKNFRSSFFKRKFYEQFFLFYNLCLYFLGERNWKTKLPVKCLYN
jgi:hypothetical protein